MKKPRLKQRAYSDLQTFIRNYEEAFYELYSDSGLWNENLIIQSYRQNAKNLKSNILRYTKERLRQDNVLGRKKAGLWQELDFHISNRLIVVYFSDDSNSDIRWIEAISIDRKPIIF